MSPLASILLIAVLFYLVVPGIGAFSVRRQWRLFRRRIEEASIRPLLDYARLHRRAGSGPFPVASGDAVRFLGALESIQGETTIWVRGRNLTLAVHMSGMEVYGASGSDEQPDQPPMRTSWARIGSLPEGVRVLVSGRLDVDGPHPVIRAAADELALVVFFDGAESSLVRRCIWSGRQLNEYWNQLTSGSLAGGTLALVILAYILVRLPVERSHAQIALTLASVPLTTMLPPGVALFLVYRWSWRHARVLRAHRDIVSLPLRYLESGHLPDGTPYVAREVDPDTASRLVEEGAVRLDPPLATSGGRLTAFGTPTDGAVTAMSDPLAEVFIVPGDPHRLSERCQRVARRYELFSALVFGIGVAVNLLLVYAGLGLVL